VNAHVSLESQLDELAKQDPLWQIFVDWRAKWYATARPQQIPPDGFTECGYMAGRGFGKTRVGAEWLAEAAILDPDAYPSAVIAPTYADVQKVCFEGPAGLLSVIPPELVLNYNSSDLIITLFTGAKIFGWTAEKPDRLRGPQHARLWCFTAGTQVTTPTGDRPIESLRPGDVVVTRRGPRRVVSNFSRVADVGRVSFANGAELLGTPDHPVYLPSGWTRMDQLKEGDEACAIIASSGVVSGGIATPADTTSEQTNDCGHAPEDCTEKCGRTTTGRYRHDVHHRDEDRGNNEICNLELLSHAQHKRHHYKPIPQPDWSQRPTHVVPCADCGRPLERKRPGALARCSKCHSRRAEEQRKYERECRHCGAGFRSRAGNFCSQRCVNLATNGATTRVLPEG
jgi:hypothetical protein